MQLNEALVQIAQIRRQMARAQVFRGYRAATTAFTAILAISLALVQSLWLGNAIGVSLWLWAGAAALSLLVVGVEVRLRAPRFAADLHDELTASAVERLAPSLVAGALLTVVWVWLTPELFWMLPGLWSVVFALGLFASRDLLPRGASAVGGWYMVAGVGALASAANGRQFLPWQMGLVFGTGQLLAAFVLYWNLERNDVRQI